MEEEVWKHDTATDCEEEKDWVFWTKRVESERNPGKYHVSGKSRGDKITMKANKTMNGPCNRTDRAEFILNISFNNNTVHFVHKSTNTS